VVFQLRTAVQVGPSVVGGPIRGHLAVVAP
jgi:hypothetical protein